MLPAQILLVLLGFTFLIVVHEMGHYLAAKWAGIRVEGFAIGMGPVVASWRRGIGLVAGPSDRRVRDRYGRAAIEMSDQELKSNGIGETEWSLRLLPLGGFVKMLGQDDLHPTATSSGARHYLAAPVGRRMVVVSAGVVANAILAVVLFMVAFLVGVRFEAPVIGDVMPGSRAAEATVAPISSDAPTKREPLAKGLQPGDRVLSVDGSPARTFSDVDIAVAMAGPDATLEMLVERPGVAEPLRVNVKPVYEKSLGRQMIGVAPARSTTLADQADVRSTIEAQLAISGLAAQGVVPGMTLESVDGTPVRTWGELEALAERSGGRTLDSRWIGPDGRRAAAVIRPEPQLALTVVPGAGSGADSGGRDRAVESLLGLAPLVRVEFVEPRSENVGVLQPGDVILRLAVKDDAEGRSIDAPRPDQLVRLVNAAPRRAVEIDVLRDGSRRTLEAKIDRSGRLGIGLGPALDVPLMAGPIDRMVRGEETVATPVAAASLMAGSRIDAVNGVAVTDWRSLWEVLRSEAEGSGPAESGSTIEITATPPLEGASPERFEVLLEPRDAETLRRLSWRLPVGPGIFEPLSTVLSADGSPVKAVAMGFRETHKMIVNTYLTIYGLINRTVAVDQLRGPVGIVHLGTAVLERGWPYLVFFLAMISANLAVLNFLPLPIVDGGLFLNLVYEKLRGAPPPLAFQNVATLAGLGLIACIFLMTFYFDVMRLVG